MAEGTEIKLSQEAFNKTVLDLKVCKDTLNSARDSFIAIDNNMESDWLGDGGTAFTLSAKVLEEQFKEIISDLDEEINDLNNAAFTMFGLDKFLATAITESILGPSGGAVAEMVNAVRSGDKIVNSVTTAIKDASSKEK